jgi:hypothetical protein
MDLPIQDVGFDHIGIGVGIVGDPLVGEDIHRGFSILGNLDLHISILSSPRGVLHLTHEMPIWFKLGDEDPDEVPQWSSDVQISTVGTTPTPTFTNFTGFWTEEPGESRRRI